MPKYIQRRLKLGFGSITTLLAIVVGIPVIATAPMPPRLVGEILHGKPIDVLYMTRSGDKILMRCYPGQRPNLVIREKSDGMKEGTLSCGN